MQSEQCHDKRPLPAKLSDNQITELSYQSLESENICLKKTVAQFQKDFLRMEAHCVNLELKYQNQALKEGQHGQFSKGKSNEAKFKQDIDVIETINIELEHKVAKLLKENKTLKKHYKELSDSIKITRAKTIEHTTSLIAQNAEFKAQLLEKGFAITTLKNELRKLKGNSVDTKFAKPSILGKPVLQSLRKQSVVRQPTAFKSERPRISKPRFASQVDVYNDLSKPVTTHYLLKERESAFAKPHHVIASSKSRNSSKSMPRFSSNDMVHNYYLEEARKKSQKKTSRIFKTVALRWVPTRKIFTFSTTTVNSEPPHGSNTDITNLHECIQTLDLSAGTSINVQEEQNLNLSAVKMEILSVSSSNNIVVGRSSQNQRYKRRCCSLILAESDSSPYAHAQTTKTYYKYQDYQDNYCQGSLLTSFQDDAKYEHVGQDTRSQDGNVDEDLKDNDLKISKLKTKSKDNDKGSRSNIAKHEGTSLQQT
ncbi:hypothetical protein Tco_1177454 [Tanacetum coccineum]